MKKLWFVCVLVVFCAIFAACELEGAPVIGPAGGYVFYDKGEYSEGWRYIECAREAFSKAVPKELFTASVVYQQALIEAKKMCTDYSSGGYSDWYLPSPSEAEKMAELLFTKYYFLDNYFLGYWTSNGFVSSQGKGTQPYSDDHNGKNKSGLVQYDVRPVRRF